MSASGISGGFFVWECVSFEYIMKNFLLTFAIFLTAFSAAEGQVTDNEPMAQTRQPNRDDQEKITIDTITPIKDLIKRFEKPWNFKGLGYDMRIGYTNDMYSIAFHKEEAIKPLVDFIITTNNNKAKVGAIYTLHLIGIDSKIGGRFSENFVNKQAREALLYLLKYPCLCELVLHLLAIDPWMSDVPKLIAAIRHSKSSYWYIINCLSFYNIPSLPIDQRLPIKIARTKLRFTYSAADTLKNDVFEASGPKALLAVKSLNSPSIVIENNLFGTEIWGDMDFKLQGHREDDNSWSVTVGGFIHYATPGGAILINGMIGNKIQYYVEGNKLYICSSVTAKDKILRWWGNQSKSYKKGLFSKDSEYRIH